MVDGAPWPVADGETVWLPAGAHSLEPAAGAPGPHLLRLTADLESARAVDATTIEFSYQSTARAIAILDRAPLEVQIDGSGEPLQSAGPKTIFLPRGQHFATIITDKQELFPPVELGCRMAYDGCRVADRCSRDTR